MYPWGLIGLDSPQAERERACKTFRHRRFNEWTYGNAWDWSSTVAARLGLADEVVKCFMQYVRNVQQFPSGFPGTPGNCPKSWGGQIGDSCGMDGPGVLATTVQEMQLQGYGSIIRVFPAWPKGWQSEFDLAAEGGFLIRSRIGKNGEIPEVRIQSTLGGPCTVINPWSDRAILRGPVSDQSVALKQRITFETKPGDTYVLLPASKIAEPPAIPLVQNEGPRWPFHRRAGDTIESYLKRTDSFGMLGIAKDGQNLTRNRVQKALAEQAKTAKKK